MPDFKRIDSIIADLKSQLEELEGDDSKHAMTRKEGLNVRLTDCLAERKQIEAEQETPDEVAIRLKRWFRTASTQAVDAVAKPDERQYLINKVVTGKATPEQELKHAAIDQYTDACIAYYDANIEQIVSEALAGERTNLEGFEFPAFPLTEAA